MTLQLLVGMYGFFSLAGDWRKHLQKLRENGVTGIRIFCQYAWSRQNVTYTPFARLKDMKKVDRYAYLPGRRERYIQQGEWVMFRKQSDPKTMLPVYDLDVLRDEYFERLTDVLSHAEQLGLTVLLEVEDWCSLKGAGIDKYWHPYYVSPQAHSTATPEGLFGDALKKYMKNYWENLLNITDDYPCVQISVMNEYDFHKKNVTGAAEKTAMLVWYWDSRRFFGEYSTVASAMRYHGEIGGMCDYYSPHGIGNKESCDREVNQFKKAGYDFPAIPGRTILSGDGFSAGTGIVDFKGRRGITLKEVPEIAEVILRNKYVGYEVLIRYKHGHARGTFEEFQDRYGGYDIVRAFGERFGTIPPPLTPTPPPPLPTPPPLPEPPKPVKHSIWHTIVRWLFGPNSLWAKIFRK